MPCPCPTDVTTPQGELHKADADHLAVRDPHPQPGTLEQPGHLARGERPHLAGQLAHLAQRDLSLFGTGQGIELRLQRGGPGIGGGLGLDTACRMCYTVLIIAEEGRCTN